MESITHLYQLHTPQLQGKLLYTSSAIKPNEGETFVELHENFLS